MEDYKKRVQRAIEGYYKRQDPQEIVERRTNQKPEQTVVRAILIWCRQAGWDVEEIEAKAKYNTTTGRYTGRAASPGLSDLCGNTPDGLAIYIEVKAEGKRTGSSLRDNQRAFLTRKIQTNCFAILADSVEYVQNTWNHFLSLPSQERKTFLMNELPEHNPRQLKLDF